MDILVRLLNAALMIAMPAALGVFVARRLKPGWRPFLIGSATFLASQILHIPFNAWLLSPFLRRLGITQPWEGWALILVATALGLSAGVFEEGARYLVLKRWLRDARTWGQAVMFGAGHGGVEAAALGVVTLVALIQGIAYRGADLSTMVDPARLDAVRAQLEAYWAAPAPLVLLGAVERAFALCVQVTLAVVVLQAVIRRNPAWLGLAIGWHAFVDALAVAAVGTLGPYWTEAILAALAAVSLFALFRLRAPETIERSLPVLDPPAPARLYPPAPPTAESLDDSRFTG